MGRFSEKITLNTLLILMLCLMGVECLVHEVEAAEFQKNQEKFIYTHDGRPDPFVPLLTSKGLVQDIGPSTREAMMEHVNKIKVSGILWDESMPVVMINNKMRKEGDVVESLTIKKINVNGVIFAYHDQTYEIILIKKKKMDDQGGDSMKAINKFSRKRMLLMLFLCSILFGGIILPVTQLSFAVEAVIDTNVDEEAAETVSDKHHRQKLLSITLKDTDLREVLNILAFKGGVNIIAGDDVDSKVNVQLKDVPWEQALDVILKTYNYTYKREDNLIRVMSLARAFEEESQLPLETRIVPLNFAKVSELKESLSKILSKRGTIEVDGRTNSLIITDVPETVQKVEIAAMELDTKTPQVLIEAMMVDIKLTDNDEWGSILNSLTNLKSKDDSNILTTGLGASGINNISFSAATDNFDIAGIIDLWVTQNKASILASPKVLTLDNQEAKIEIIEKIPYVETVDTGGGATTNIKFEEAGIKLSVTPHITSGKFISMNVKPEQAFSTGSFGGRPVIDERKAETNLLVRDGQTIVIGGLRQSNDTYSFEKVPVLGDIPFVGLLFKKKVKIRVETELVLFVTPHIILQSMLSDRDLELYEKLGNTEMIVIDQKTEMQRLNDFTETVRQKFKAKKIAEDEVLIRERESEAAIDKSKPRRKVKKRAEPVRIEKSQDEPKEMDPLEIEALKFRESLKMIDTK